MNYGGYVGIIGGSYVIGVVAAMLYLQLYSRPTLFVFLANVIYLCMLTLSFSAFEFFRAQFLYLILVSFIVGSSVRVVRQEKQRGKMNEGIR
jgi:predicted neutral ceramidase superfamily lipid hydrolase